MRYVILGFLAFIFFSAPAYAQSMREKHGMQAFHKGMEARYYVDVEAIFKNVKQIDEKIPSLRVNSLYTRGFTPISQDIVDDLTEIAFRIQSTENVEEQQDFIIEYQKFLKEHLADLDVISMAYSLAKEDPKFGNPSFYDKIRKALIQLINMQTSVRDGKSPQMSYMVYNLAEENYFLRKIGGRIIKSETYNVEGRVYNVHDIQLGNNEEGEVIQYYFDISDTVRVMEVKRSIKQDDEGKIIPKL